MVMVDLSVVILFNYLHYELSYSITKKNRSLTDAVPLLMHYPIVEFSITHLRLENIRCVGIFCCQLMENKYEGNCPIVQHEKTDKLYQFINGDNVFHLFYIPSHTW